MIAAKLGFPIFATYGLVSALTGAGLIAVGSRVNFDKWGTAFFLPLITTPLIAVVLSSLFYGLFHYSRRAAGITGESCRYIGKKLVPLTSLATAKSTNFSPLPVLDPSIGTPKECSLQYSGRFFGMNFQPLVNKWLYASAAVISFNRGLNDMPKLVSLLLITHLFGIPVYISLLASAMAMGGMLNAKEVAATTSKKISMFDHGRGFTANLKTGSQVITATKLGLSVSTTRVSVGSIYGIGLVNITANDREISKIIVSWVLPLPIAAVISTLFYGTLHFII